MKKFPLLLFFIFLFGCEKIGPGEPEQSGKLPADFELPDVLYASVSDKTRTYADGKKVFWQNEDALSFFAGNVHNVRYSYTGEDGSEKVEFVMDDEHQGIEGNVLSKSLAVYPYSGEISVVREDGEDLINLDYPDMQQYCVNSFGKDANIMVAAGKNTYDNNLYFRNACGYLVIKLYGAGKSIKRITLSSLDNQTVIAGQAVVKASNDSAPVITMAEDALTSVILDCTNGGSGVALGADADHATEFWFALPPVTLKGFKILVTPTSGLAFEMETSKQVDIIRNEVQPMAPIQFIANAQSSGQPAPNQLFYTKSGPVTDLIKFNFGNQIFDANITAHYYDETTKKFIIECDAPIKEIKDDAFRGYYGMYQLTSVSLPSQLERIGKNAFYINSLREIVIPGSVTLIGNNAFRENALRRISFLSGEKELIIENTDVISTDEIGVFLEAEFNYIYVDRDIRCEDGSGEDLTTSLFYHKGESTDVVEFGPNVTKIINNMFHDCNMKNLVIPGNITHIMQSAFFNCSDIENIVFLPNPAGIPLTIEYNQSLYGNIGPFKHSNLVSINLNREINYTLDVIDSNDEGVFSENNRLETLVIGDQVRTLSDYMFASSDVLKSVTIPEGVTSIGKYAFYDCDALASINIPSKVTYIDEGTFENCDALTSITIPSTVTSIGKKAFHNCDGLASLDIPSSVNSIGESVFENCDALTSVTVPSTLTSIGDSAFRNCDGLASATISTPMLGSNMFDDCDNLANVTIDGTLDAINVDAFTGCSKLSTLNISGSVETIGDGAFDGFDLTSLNISGHVGTIGANAFDDNDKMTSFTVTGSVGTIGASAFEDSDALKTVSITGTVNEVCEYAFSDCDNVTTLSIRANKVGVRAYEDMDGLISATLYGATVGDGVFYDCNALQTVIIDGGVNSIGDDAFYNCGKLSSVTFNEGINTLTIGYQPSSTDDLGPFYQSPLATINLNRELEPSATYKEQLDAWDMGIFTNKHYNDTDLTTTVTLGSNVKTIWPWMFSCVRMQNIEIPASVTSIGKEAFSYCYILDTVTCKGTTPPTLGEDVFYKSGELKYIYVPSGSLNSYQSNWNDYKGKIYEK